MKRLRKIFLNEYVLVFLFCLAVVHGPAFSLMDNYDLSTCIDCKTYLGVAQLDLDQSPIRRYRPIVPLLAGSVNYLMGGVFNVIKPTNFPGNFPLSFSFYLVNCLLISLWGVVIYRFCRAYKLSQALALIGTMVMLTCRWTPYMAGTPIADSLYCLVIGLALLGIKERNNTATVLAIFLGPFAKESFVFIAPIIFFFSGIGKNKQILYFLLSGILVFSFRYAYDLAAGTAISSGLAADIDHINYIVDNSLRLLSFHGIYDVLSNLGLWLFFPIIGLAFAKGYLPAIKQYLEYYMLFFMLSVLLHMVLSSSFERMFYLSMPLLCLFIAVSIKEILKEMQAIEK